MGFVNQGSQYITFDFKHKAKGYDFNRLNRNILRKGIYRGMSISYSANDVLVSTGSVLFDCYFQQSATVLLNNIQVKIDFDATYAYSNLLPSDTTINPSTGTYYDELIYLYYEYGEVTFNYAEFRSTSIRAIQTLPEDSIIIGQVSFNLAQNITGFSYTNRTYGLFTYETGFAFPDTSYFFNISHPSLTTTKKWSVDGTNLATGIHKLFIPNTTPVSNGGVQEYDLLLTNVNNTTLVKNNLQVNTNSNLLGTLGVSGITSITNTTNSTSSTSGALVVSGGVGIANNLYIGNGVVSVTSGSNATSLSMLTLQNDGVWYFAGNTAAGALNGLSQAGDKVIAVNKSGINTGALVLGTNTTNSTGIRITPTTVSLAGVLDITGALSITSDLSVDTNVLKVVSSTNRVGINKSVPSVDLDVSGSALISSTLGINRTSAGVPLDIQSDSAAFAIDVRGRASDNIVVNRFLDNSGSVRYRMGLWNDDTLVFQDSSGNTKLTLNQSGDLFIGRDIYFGSTERKLFLYNFATNNRMYIQADSSGNFELWGGVSTTTSLLLETTNLGDLNITRHLNLLNSGSIIYANRQDYDYTVVNNGSATVTVDFANRSFIVLKNSVTAAITLSIPSMTTKMRTIYLLVRSSGSYSFSSTTTQGGTIRWPSGFTPSVSGSGAYDFYSFITNGVDVFATFAFNYSGSI